MDLYLCFAKSLLLFTTIRVSIKKTWLRYSWWLFHSALSLQSVASLSFARVKEYSEHTVIIIGFVDKIQIHFS